MLTGYLEHNQLALDRLFEKYARHTALLGNGIELSFADLEARILQVVRHIRSICSPAGLKIGFYADRPELTPILMQAAWQTGAIFVPLDVKAPLDSLLQIVQPDLLITDQVVEKNKVDLLIHPHDLSLDGSLNGKSRERLKPLRLDAEATVILTSGSSGTPKGVVHTVGNYLYSAWGTINYLSMDANDSWLASLPLFHVGGLIIFLRTLLSGGKAIIPEDSRELEPEITRYQPSFLSLVPTQLMRFLENQETGDLMRQCRGILLGGAAAPEWLIRKAICRGIPVLPTYGSTESCAQATGVSTDASEADRLTSGKPLPFRTVRLDEDQNIIIGGETIFKRYLDKTSMSPPAPDGEFKTSDIGRFDTAGNLVVLGRSDQVFQSGGENINPFEIEHALLAQETIRVAVVVPVTHSEFGQVPWAFVEMTAPFSPDAIRKALKKRLAGYKIPKNFLEIPTGTEAGAMKPDRQRLAKLAADIQAGKA